ncbi:dTDP-4-dehydrorhamnose 3,5-epimerase family protein [Nocardiopsis halotolerans]|uniref:dTDP-4-dehydrorhamnose 3,5-epimerase family protein n=1 Tax=Nocardiopsis halotolerans TaxID=124252 RepID=UPI00034AB8AA|nr:dTDP-4-dehydrorhamnose 3,5-epimerase family protein [Nocardiopsis halotolerans]
MRFEETDLPGVLVIRQRVHTDQRGDFHESFRADLVSEATRTPFTVAQINYSTSRRNTIRGIHGVVSPPGQAKYVSCANGALLDVVVDLRTGSPTFGRHTVNVLEAAEGTAVFVPEGFGHGFRALTDDARICYVLSSAHVPGTQFEIHPLDPELDLPWGHESPPVLSGKDAGAQSLQEALRSGVLTPWSPSPTGETQSDATAKTRGHR